MATTQCGRFFSINLLVVLVLISNLSQALDNGIARTPPMGWMSWVRFECNINCDQDPQNCISYELFSRMAKSMKEKGFVDAGYNYVNIDDCWSEMERDNDTQMLVPHKERFRGKNGIKELASEMGELGVKLGIYGDCGTKTCAKYPAQLSVFDSDVDNFYDKDSETFYSWGVESFKFDGCNISPGKSEQICPGMSKALEKARNKTGKAILLTCEWPYYMMSTRHVDKPLTVDWELVKSSCNLWRHYEDIYDSWLSIEATIDYCVNMQEEILVHHGPGGWFDPDQLVVGGFGLSHDQARVHMAIWSLWSAPLFMSNDVEKLNQKEIDLLQNEKLIQVNQDPLGIWAQMVMQNGFLPWATGTLQVFVKPIKSSHSMSRLYCPDFVIAYLYRGSLGNSVKFSLPIRDILKASRRVIEEASKRLGNSSWTDKCMQRINGTELKKPDEPIQGFIVDDLMDLESQQLLKIDGNLKLDVNPTGIRVVKLTESMSS